MNALVKIENDSLSSAVRVRAAEQFGKELAIELKNAATAEEINTVDRKLSTLQAAMERSNLFSRDHIRPVNNGRMIARWKLGRALAEIERQRVIGPGRGKVGVEAKTKFSGRTSFSAILEKLGLQKSTALEAQRIATLPDEELKKAISDAASKDTLLSFFDLVTIARPYWYKESRERKHKAIHAAAKAAGKQGVFGPFPLIYCDSPTEFETYSEKGLERTPTQHYPTLTHEQLCDFEIDGVPVADIAHKNAALLYWCTSSNIHLALEVIESWGFEFKASAVWVKDKAGLGLVFRNKHEVLLYATRGDMPGPQWQPDSVFEAPRGRHSEKPDIVRKAIEKMYPDFDESTRLELFARERVKGWTPYGFEADSGS